MSDLIERLRALDGTYDITSILDRANEAADEITRLRAVNAELLEALEWLQLTCEGDGDAFQEAYKDAVALIAKAKETT